MRRSSPFSLVSVVTLCLVSHRDGDFLQLSGLRLSGGVNVSDPRLGRKAKRRRAVRRQLDACLQGSAGVACSGRWLSTARNPHSPQYPVSLRWSIPTILSSQTSPLRVQKASCGVAWVSPGRTGFSRLPTGTGAFRESATNCNTALTFHSSAPSNHSMNSSIVAPLSRFSKRAETGSLVVSQLWNRKDKGGEVWIGRPGF